MIIAVIGGDSPPPPALAHAGAVGRAIAGRGHTLICGGRGGVMLEAARGAQDAGGLTIGILPGDDSTEANTHIDVPIPTGLGHARNAVVARSAQAVIAIGGSYGTLSEIAFAAIFGRPIVGLDTWTARDHEGHDLPIHPAATALEAVTLAESLATGTGWSPST